MNNYKIGSEYESAVAALFRSYGYWAHCMQVKTSGQPVDVIASKGFGVGPVNRNSGNTITFLVDAKHVDSKKVSFTFDRVEPNQITSLQYARDFANMDGDKRLGFVVFFDRDESVRWLSINELLKRLENDENSVKAIELQEFVEVLDDANNSIQ